MGGKDFLLDEGAVGIMYVSGCRISSFGRYHLGTQTGAKTRHDIPRVHSSSPSGNTQKFPSLASSPVFCAFSLLSLSPFLSQPFSETTGIRGW